MRKKKILLLIPFMLVAGLLLYCWMIFISSEYKAMWKHHAGLVVFITVTILLLTDFTKAVIGLGVFLLLATFNVLAITPAISTHSLRIGILQTPPVQVLSLGLLVLYFILNLDTLIDIRLDYKKAKGQKAQNVV